MDADTQAWMDEMGRREEAEAKAAPKIVDNERCPLPEPVDISNGKGGLDQNKFAKWLIASNHHHFVSMNDTGEVLYYDNGVYRLGGERVIDELLIKTMDGEKCTISKGREAVHLVGGRVGIERDEMDGDEDLINLKNGVYNIKTGGFLPHSPDMLMMKQMNIVYDATATCPKFDKFLHEVVSDEEVEFIYELFGYMLLPRKRFETAVFLEGSGSNGKSVLMNVMKHFIGKDSFSEVAPSSLNSGNEYAVADIYGKSLNVVDDLGNDVVDGVGAFKSIISGNSLRARQIYKPSFSFVPNTLCVFGCNDVPETTDTSEGYYRRMRIVKFVNKFEGDKKERHLITKLIEVGEIAGIFNKGIEAIRKVIVRGDFSGAKTTGDMREEYMRSANPMLLFIDMAYEITLGKEYITKDAVYNAYAVWCMGMGIPAQEMGKLTSTFKAMGVTISKPMIDDEQVRCYSGIRQKRKKATDRQPNRQPPKPSTDGDNEEIGNYPPPCCKQNIKEENCGNMGGDSCLNSTLSTTGDGKDGCLSVDYLVAYQSNTPPQQSKRLDLDQSTADRIKKALYEAMCDPVNVDGCDIDSITRATNGLAKSTVHRYISLYGNSMGIVDIGKGLYRSRA